MTAGRTHFMGAPEEGLFPMRNEARLSTAGRIAPAVALLGAMSAVLAGCPVWGPVAGGGGGGPVPTVDGGFADGSRADGDTGGGDTGGGTRCTSFEQCGAGEYCDPVTMSCVAAPSCANTAACPNGYFCNAAGTCTPGCSTNTDCTALGAGLVCNTTSRRCQPSGACANDGDCSGGQLCVGGTCRAPSDVCRFNYQCGAGQECVDGRCMGQCGGTTTCSNGQTCQNGFCQYPTMTTPGTGTGGPSDPCARCTGSQVCSNGLCLAACVNDMACGAGQYCDRGACRVDDRRPEPFCTPPSNGCASGSVCVDGVCRISCPARTNEECMRRDVNFTTCDTMQICRYSNEANPQCRLSSDCPMGQRCVNALCR